MIQLEKPVLTGSMPVVWPTILDLGRDECKRVLRKLELEAYAGVISALRAQGDLTKDKKDLLGELTKILGISTERHRAEVRRAVNDERLTTIAYHMSGPNSSSEWSIEGRRLVPLMPRLVPQTAFTVTANSVASATANHNNSLLLPAQTGNKEVVVCYSYTSTTCTPTSAVATSGIMGNVVKSPRPPSPSSNVVVLPSGSTVYVKSVSCSDEDEKPRKRRRTNSSSSSSVVLKEVSRVSPQVSKSITLPVSAAHNPKMSNIMQSIANSLPPHLSPVKITFTKPTIQTTSTTTQKVIIVTTSPSSNFVPNILSKSQHSALSKLGSASSLLSGATHKQTVVFPSGPAPSSAAHHHAVAVTTVTSSSPSVVMSTVASCAGSGGVKVASARLPSPKSMPGSAAQIMAQFPKQQTHQHPHTHPHTHAHTHTHPQQQHSPKQHLAASGMGLGQNPAASQGSKPTIQIKQESGVKIITQTTGQPSKILPKPLPPGSRAEPSHPIITRDNPIVVVSSNGAIMTTKLLTQPTASQSTYTRPTVSPGLGARLSAAGGATYVKTTSGSIITVVPKSLATLGGKILSSNIVSGTTTKITTIPMTSKPNVIVVQKTTGKGTTIQGLPGKNVVTTLLNAGGEKGLQTVQGSKPAIITASRPITKMIVTQPKGLGAGPTASATKIIPTKIVYGQQGKTQVLIKPKPVFQTAVLSEHTRQLVTETLQQATHISQPAHSSSSSSSTLISAQSGTQLTSQSGTQQLSQQGVTSLSVREVTQSHSQNTSGQSGQDGNMKEENASSTGEASSSHSSSTTQEPGHVVHVLSTGGQEWTEQEVCVESTPTIIYQEIPEPQSATSTIKALLELQQTAVKEKGESSKPRHTIDLSQMAVPLQLSQEKKSSPESPKPSSSEAEASTDYIPPGKVIRLSSECDDVVVSSNQKSSSSYKSIGGGGGGASCVVTVVTKPATASSAAAAVSSSATTATHTHHMPSDRVKPESVLEVGEMEGDTLDPQTGLFYRSTQPSTDPIHPSKQPATLPLPLPTSKAEAASTKTQAAPAPPPPPPPLQLQTKQITQPSSSTSSSSFSPTILIKKLPKLLTHTQASKPTPITQIPKDRLTLNAPLAASLTAVGVHVKTATMTTTGGGGGGGSSGVSTSKPPVVVTPQLPRLQQAPTQTSHHRPMHTNMSHPPPLQAHHPVSTEKPNASQQPIITQSATVTKITFGSSVHPPVFSSAEAAAKLTPEASTGPSVGSSEPKPSVSDILKISMMQAQIDPSVEPVVVDSSSDCGILGKKSNNSKQQQQQQQQQQQHGGKSTMEAQTTSSSSSSSSQQQASVSGTLDLDAGQFISSSGGMSMHRSHSKSQQFTAQRSKEDMDVIEVIPQFSILPDSSQSNVVVEPSGFLQITNYTSQTDRETYAFKDPEGTTGSSPNTDTDGYTSQTVDEEDSPMEQEVDSSNDDSAPDRP